MRCPRNGCDMNNTKRLLQVNLFVAVLVSSTLLGIAMESMSMIAVGVIGATLGFLITDLMHLFQLRGVIANIASVLILFLAMKDFFSVDGTGKLVSVANLLVYLQTVLMFQNKTPRLNWQVMVLSLLQVVVSAIFSLDLEGGLLMLTYFLVIGAAMFLQSIYTQQFEIERVNKSSSEKAIQSFGWTSGESDPAAGGSMAASSMTGGPVTFFDITPKMPLRVSFVVGQLILWGGIAFAFTLVLFYLAPRHAAPWYGPLSTKVTTAGVSKSVDLDERGIIELSGQVMFRVKFKRPDGSPLRLLGTPYFRGLALSDLVIKNGKTDWRAPQDRIANEHYQLMPAVEETDLFENNSVLQSFTMEETEDPLVYGVFPVYRTEKTPKKMHFCHEISGLTRCKLRDTIDLAPYKYQAATLIDPAGRFAMSWPYVSNTPAYVRRPMSEDRPQFEWLTKMDPKRYETLCALSDQVAKENEEAGGTQLDLLRRMEGYFQNVGRFRYTLDFRNIKRDESLDPIEDFIRNHRSGHCELYASALTLMLRRQKIPARLIVGFRGGSYNQSTNGYMVRASNAHAWVEAYLPKEDCTTTMLERGFAGEGGAWVLLEATPLGNSNDFDDEEALDIARNVWDDYVLGRDNETDSEDYATPMFAWLAFVDMDEVESQISQLKRTASQPWFKFGIPGLIFGLFMFVTLRRSLKDQTNEAGEKVSLIRRMVASAISLISPELSKWVMGRRDYQRVEFYERLVAALKAHGLERQPNQTHREFADQVAEQFSEHAQANLIQRNMRSLTAAFNAVRFGKRQLNGSEAQAIQAQVDEITGLLLGG